MRDSDLPHTDDVGFSLVELLVVVVILGILSAVAIAVFVNQREKAVRASMVSDLKEIATYEEAYLAGTGGTYWSGGGSASVPFSVGADTVDLSPGNAVTAIAHAGTSFCLSVVNARNPSVPTMYYDSASGGLLATGASCG